MAYKSSKTVTSYSSQKTTRSIETTKIVSKTQTSSSGLVSSYRPTATADRATSSAASSVNKTYQPVYDQTRRLAESGISTRNSPAYSSLRGVPTTSFSQNALSKAGGNLFYSFGNSKDNNRSTSLVNNERTGEVPVPTWKSSTTVAPTSAPVAGTSRQFRSASVPVLSRSTNSTLEKYDLRKPAYVVIFHHLFKNDKALFRKGSEHDLKLIKDFFKKYNAKISDICEDFSVAKVKKKMSEVRTKNLSNYSCLIVVIMSHGGLNDKIQTVDGFYQLDNAVVEPTLMNDTLKGKPRLFFVQACKGDAVMESDITPTATNKFDILKCFSTYEGTLSYRNSMTGSTFIQTLFELIRQHSDKEIIDIMRLMRNEFDKNKVGQAPTETSTLTKQFFFEDLKKP